MTDERPTPRPQHADDERGSDSRRDDRRRDDTQIVLTSWDAPLVPDHTRSET
jgi:hypothetical protein